jgi:hypothetical protein
MGDERSELRDLRALRGDKLFNHEGHETHEGRGAKEEAVSYGEDV